MAKFISLSSGTRTASSSGVQADEETEARAGRCLALKMGAAEMRAERSHLDILQMGTRRPEGSPQTPQLRPWTQKMSWSSLVPRLLLHLLFTGTQQPLASP